MNITLPTSCISDEPALGNVLFPVGDVFLRSTDGKLYHVTPDAKFDLVQNDYHATLINPEWKRKTVASKKNLTQLVGCHSPYTIFVNSLDRNKPVLYATMFHRLTNGKFRPMRSPKSVGTYFMGPVSERDPTSFVANPPAQFKNWIDPKFLPEINPARVSSADVDEIVWKFESPDFDKVSAKFGGNAFSVDSCKLTRDTFGASRENFYFDGPNLTCKYLLEEIKTVAQLQSFRSLFSAADFQTLMSSLPMQFDPAKMSLLKGTGDLPLYYQQWFSKQPETIQNSIISSLCNKFPTARECLCAMRHLDADYKKFGALNNMPDACWFMPCKNTSEYNVTSDLQKPNCPNVCEILTQFIDNNNIQLAANSNIIDCKNQPPKPPVPEASFWATNAKWLIIIGVLIIAWAAFKFV